MEVGEKVMSDPGRQSLLLGWLFEFRVFSFPLKILFVIMWAIPFTCLWWTCLSFGQCRLRLWCDKFVWLNLDQRGDPNVCPIDLLALVQNEWNSSFKTGLFCSLHKWDNSPVVCPIRAMMLWCNVSFIMLVLMERLSQPCKMVKAAFCKACWYY